ncbi:PhzF family phenazine biosynthesis protein [Agrobacterium rosae]|uniref:PhzF family phenazine biosynthesis protein n=1 Tax=Agrobacterium rosae TaxID=1972867 RepID=A0ABU4W1Y5_9HYPH|nr:PhzF family phenazine biosynthesis protein [Agrobacterium rosae]MDX8331452.1 PhzF family phenazine biosynthesis protein [Agrobacterium rosae]
MAISYSIYDVFTRQKLAGNPLAVMFGADGLDDATMLAIAREMNLSETVFVRKSDNPAYVASLRIFTPASELPFAGHPTVGAAIAIAERNHTDGEADMVSVLEELVGPVRCAIRIRTGEASFAEFDLPRKSARVSLPLDHAQIADAIGLAESQLGFENHVPSIWTAGVPFLAIPVQNLSAMQEVDFDPTLWLKLAPLVEGRLVSAYLYCRGGVDHAAKFHTRMFSPSMGISEDPATGAAAAAFSGAIHHFDSLADGHYPILIEQGIEMGRPSHIHLNMDVKEREIARARIGGHAIRVATGTFDI